MIVARGSGPWFAMKFVSVSISVFEMKGITKLAPCVPLETNPTLPLVRQFLRSAGRQRPRGVDFFCDAAVLAEGGIPSVVFGPGDIAQAHTTDEWISLASLEHGKTLLLGFLKSLP